MPRANYAHNTPCTNFGAQEVRRHAHKAHALRSYGQSLPTKVALDTQVLIFLSALSTYKPSQVVRLVKL